MQASVLFLSIAMPVISVSDNSAINLDIPSDAQATAAYRAVPAVAAKGSQDQQQTVKVKSCKPAVGKPGVNCEVTARPDPSAQPKDVAIHFERGPDAAWVATLEQTAP